MVDDGLDDGLVDVGPDHFPRQPAAAIQGILHLLQLRTPRGPDRQTAILPRLLKLREFILSTLLCCFAWQCDEHSSCWLFYVLVKQVLLVTLIKDRTKEVFIHNALFCLGPREEGKQLRQQQITLTKLHCSPTSK